MDFRTVILVWSPWGIDNNRFMNMEDSVFLNCMRDYVQKDGPSVMSYDFDPGEFEPDVHEGDRFYILRRGFNDGFEGLVMCGEIVSDVFTEVVKDPDTGRETTSRTFKLLPTVFIDPHRANYITIARLVDDCSSCDWLRMSNGTILSPEQADTLNDIWTDFMTLNYEQFIHFGSERGKKNPKAVFLDGSPDVLSDDSTLYDRLYRRFHHKCDICGFDLDYSFARLPNIPRVIYYVRKYKGKTGAQIRNVKCLCRNCAPLIERYSWEELTDKVRMISTDTDAFHLSMRVNRPPSALS